MQKAQVEANKYFWRRYSEKTKEVSPFQENRFNTYRRNNWDLNGLRFYYILLSDDAPEFCNYTSKGNTVMSQETLENALDFIDKENAVPIFVGKLDRDFPEYVSREVNFKITTPDMLYNPKSHVEQIVHVIKAIDDVKNGECTAGHERACIVLICPQNIKDMFDICKGLIVKYSRINIVKRDFHLWEETDKKEYCKIIDFLRDESKEQKQRQLQINVITDSDEYGAECNAGVSSFTIAPNGRIYVCPGFYYESADNYIGDVVSGFLTNNRTNKLYERRSSPICSQCDNMKCRRCVFDNKKKTGNANIPSFEQCELAGL
jgi:CXXX repeat peptide maturase